MKIDDFGIEQVTDEDRAYNGSYFRDVRDAIFANPYQKVWGGEGEPLPLYKARTLDLLRGIFPFGKRYLFGQASERTVDSHADLRWGPDRMGFRRIIHPNGICLTGLWEITADTEYSGYFKSGSRGLVVGRYSTCCGEVRRGDLRALALVGKLFPTDDPGHDAPLRTASFITMEDIAGDYTRYINDAELRNAPDITIWRRPILALVGILFVLVDKRASIRQVYQIAELGKPLGQPTRAPEFMRLLVDPDQPRIEGDRLDLRDEVMAQIFDTGDAEPKRKITFHIEVTDEGTTQIGAGGLKRKFHNWRRIGQLTFDNAAASYNGDFVVHFNHPGWRENRNDTETANRPVISSP
jgi:hypothetical protein